MKNIIRATCREHNSFFIKTSVNQKKNGDTFPIFELFSTSLSINQFQSNEKSPRIFFNFFQKKNAFLKSLYQNKFLLNYYY